MPLALLSVHDKTGLPELGAGLAARGWTLLASGGSAACLRSAGLEVIDVAQRTRSPEMLGGRVKTLHPAIHGGILARDSAEDRAELASLGLEAIDLVVANLYPFEETLARPGATEVELVEEIDIGGVALIRAAAKNHSRVSLLVEPADYPAFLAALEAGGPGPAARRELAKKGFERTRAYDSAIVAWFGAPPSQAGPSSPAPMDAQVGTPAEATVRIGPSDLPDPKRAWIGLRYGENPHQEGAFLSVRPGSGPLGGRVLQGKELSYNNYLDLDAAWKSVNAFTDCAVSIVKHLSPCGIALGGEPGAAWERALASDPVSAFGGVVAFNRPLDGRAATLLSALFLECVAAPAFEPAAREILASKKNLRLVEADPAFLAGRGKELRTVTGGWLAQDWDRGDPEGGEWRVVSARQPTKDELRDLAFAWTAVREVRSNAILLAREGATVGIGGGQTNRVDAVRQAVERAGPRAAGAVLASDAFFPFADGLEAAARAGVTAAIHPGGSLRNAEVIAAADRAGLALLATGVRHFRH